MPAKTLGDIRRQRELKQEQLAKLLGCNPSFVSNRIDLGKIAPNHPLVPRLADVLGMSVPEIQVLCKDPEMSAGQLSLSKLHLGKPSPRSSANGKRPKKKKAGGGGGGQSTGWWQQRKAELRARQAEKKPKNGAERRVSQSKHLVRVPGTAVTKVASKKVATRVSKRAYNALRLMDPETRQSARSLAMATVLAAMNGQKYLDVAIPTIGMANILNDWFRLKGIPEPVVTTVDFEEIFG